jgi:hypothetical protein
MTSSVQTPVQQAITQTPVWEDMIDIFHAPAAVFARRRDGRFVAALITLTLVFTFLTISAQSALAPVYDAEFTRGMAKAIEKAPELTAEQIATFRSFSKITMIVGGVLFMPLVALLVGGLLRLMGALFDAALTFKLAVMITIYAQIPRVLQHVVWIVQGFLLPPESLNSRFAVGFGPARFMDVDATSPVLMALAERFDLFTLWATVLLAIGLRVLGKIPGGRAYLAAALVWVLGSLMPILGALRAG